MSHTDMLQWICIGSLMVWCLLLSLHTLATGELAQTCAAKIRELFRAFNGPGGPGR